MGLLPVPQGTVTQAVVCPEFGCPKMEACQAICPRKRAGEGKSVGRNEGGKGSLAIAEDRVLLYHCSFSTGTVRSPEGLPGLCGAGRWEDAGKHSSQMFRAGDPGVGAEVYGFTSSWTLGPGPRFLQRSELSRGTDGGGEEK